ncbi:hypothetical protein CKM354_000296300 [Cercospora kikuchii]|uniref:Uncharacterized protein n=1 Tax=Cercospora kikuchii TaxID=84275 RepID=A0A9P3FEA6_9PEZI|nr:uncharacterized protein CKM354_000296300 [Cercospora kikuchii]GIZ39584.1 hypothetical protein CKM354_000296300 [Cercospora kikuchii]
MSTATIDLCLPLAKYSYAESEKVHSSVQWTHYSAAGLCLLVQGTAGGHGELSLHVVERTTVMESLDIARYVDRASDMRHYARQAGSVLRTDQLPIFAIAKQPNVALRLQLQTGRTRRIQLGLSSAVHHQQVVEALSHRGVEFQEARPATSAQNAASAIRPVARNNDRDILQQAPAAVNHQQPTPSPFHPPSVRIGSLGQHQQQASAGHREARMVAPRLIRPFSAANHGAAGSAITPRPHSVAAMNPVPATQNGRERSRSPERVTGSSSSGASQPGVSSLRPGLGHSSCPTSAPLAQGSDQSPPSTSHEMTHGATRSSSRPSSALDLPPLRMPRLVESRPNTAANIATPDTTARPSMDRSNVYSEQTVAKDATLVAPQLTGGMSDIQFRSSLPPANNKSQPTPAETCSNVHASKGIARLSSLMDAPHEIEEPLESSVVPQHAELPVVRSSGQPRSQEISLATYEAQCVQDRQAALDQFMMDVLDDPKFETLCADVENCWRRSILGL